MLLNIWIRIKMTIENTINEMFEAEKAEEQAKIKTYIEELEGLKDKSLSNSNQEV